MGSISASEGYSHLNRTWSLKQEDQKIDYPFDFVQAAPCDAWIITNLVTTQPRRCSKTSASSWPLAA